MHVQVELSSMCVALACGDVVIAIRVKAQPFAAAMPVIPESREPSKIEASPYAAIVCSVYSSYRERAAIIHATAAAASPEARAQLDP